MDRVLLNPWVSRAGNATFLGGVVLFVARLLLGSDPLLLAALPLLAVGVVLIAAPRVSRWRGRRKSSNATEPPTERRLAELRRLKQEGDIYLVRWHEGPAYPASRAAMGPTWYHGGWEDVQALREELRRFLAAELPEFRLPQIQYHGHPPDMAAATKDLADDMKELAKFIARYGGRIGQ